MQSLLTTLAQRKEELAPPKMFSFSAWQKAAPDTLIDATDGHITDCTDGASSPAKIPKLPVIPVCGFADQDS